MGRDSLPWSVDVLGAAACCCLWFCRPAAGTRGGHFMSPASCAASPSPRPHSRFPPSRKSGQTLDRSTIMRHLLSDSSNPFTRGPLTADQLIPQPELKVCGSILSCLGIWCDLSRQHGVAEANLPVHVLYLWRSLRLLLFSRIVFLGWRRSLTWRCRWGCAASCGTELCKLCGHFSVLPQARIDEFRRSKRGGGGATPMDI